MIKNQPIVLIVDDEPLGRDSLEGLLMNQGYQLAFAANGNEALLQAEKLIPDLILLDVMMPDMDGFEVCSRLRGDPILADVPVVLVTALDDRDSRLRGIEAGADDFVTKPFDRTELRTRVRTITRLNRFRRLVAERTKFEWVVAQASDGYLISDDSGYISYANQQARLYLGLPQTEDTPIDETFHKLIRKQYRPEPEGAWVIWPDHISETSPRYLVRPETSASQPFWLRVETLELDAGTNTANSSWIVLLRDVTAETVHAQDKWHFHAMISHKFRTPLIPLVTGLELMKNHSDELNPDDFKMLMDRAYHGIMRLQAEINDILEYMDATSASRTKAFKMSQLPSLIKELCTELELDDIQTGIAPELLEPTITLALANSSFCLVLREIFENARKFHPKQSPNIEVTATLSPVTKNVHFKITDNGIHLSSEQLAQVWTPYYQGEKYFTGEAAGMGLGLAIVASIVWGVGGTCRMYNRASAPGIVVELILPIQKDDTGSDQ